MAWSYAGWRGGSQSKTSGPALSVSPNAIIPAGAIALAICVADNINGGGVTKAHICADFQGNEWRKIVEHTNTAAAAAGITCSLWLSHLTTALQTTDPIGLVLNGAVLARAIGVHELAVAAGNTVRVAGVASSEQDGTSSPTVTLSGLEPGEYLFIGVVARENDDLGTYTQDTDYTDRQKFGTTGGTAATNVSIITGSRLLTGTGDTFNPTNLSAASDVVTLLVALQEVPAFNLTCTSVVQQGGKVFVRWSDGLEVEYASLAEALIERDKVYAHGKELMRGMAIARYLRVDPTAANPSILQGKTIRWTDYLNEMVKVF